MGALVKRCLAPRMGWAPSAVYHVAVMPCYDKKLEAARPDLALPGAGGGGGGDNAAGVERGRARQGRQAHVYVHHSLMQHIK